MGNIKLFCLYSNYLHIFIIAVKSRKTTFFFCFLRESCIFVAIIKK